MDAKSEFEKARFDPRMHLGCGDIRVSIGWQDEIVAEIEKKDCEIERLREALEWYGEQARLARLIHSEGDAGREALSRDGGSKARAALAPKPAAGSGE